MKTPIECILRVRRREIEAIRRGYHGAVCREKPPSHVILLMWVRMLIYLQFNDISRAVYHPFVGHAVFCPSHLIWSVCPEMRTQPTTSTHTSRIMLHNQLNISERIPMRPRVHNMHFTLRRMYVFMFSLCVVLSPLRSHNGQLDNRCITRIRFACQPRLWHKLKVRFYCTHVCFCFVIRNSRHFSEDH